MISRQPSTTSAGQLAVVRSADCLSSSIQTEESRIIEQKPCVDSTDSFGEGVDQYPNSIVACTIDPSTLAYRVPFHAVFEVFISNS